MKVSLRVGFTCSITFLDERNEIFYLTDQQVYLKNKPEIWGEISFVKVTFSID